MVIRVVATLACVCWWVAEYIRSSIGAKAVSENRDEGTSRFWDFAHLIALIGIVVGFSREGHLRDGTEYVPICGIVLMLLGVSVRWLAIRALGEYFTGKVSIVSGQHIVQTGLYRYVRHPAYSGSLLAYLGMGLAFVNWISFVLIFCPVFFAALFRMRVEERVLGEVFGEEYRDYAKNTKRLVPGVY